MGGKENKFRWAQQQSAIKIKAIQPRLDTSINKNLNEQVILYFISQLWLGGVCVYLPYDFIQHRKMVELVALQKAVRVKPSQLA